MVLANDPRRATRGAPPLQAVLADGLGKWIDAFAYRFGDAGPDRRVQPELLREAGYRSALACWGAIVRLGGNGPDRFTRLALGLDSDRSSVLASVAAEPALSPPSEGMP